VRVVKLLLGNDAIANHEIDFGPSLVVLGVEVRLHMKGFSCRPAAEKATRIIACMKQAIATRVLTTGCASKLAGRLLWSCQHLFHRVGRAMLRPLFDHIKTGCADVSDHVCDALRWWLCVFELDLAQEFAWELSHGQPVHLFCDAASTPARLAAVAWIDGVIGYTDCPPPPAMLAVLAKRKDNQIMALELMSIVLALSTFADACSGRRVVIHSDNKGAEEATRSGRAKSFDHGSLVHGMWTHALVAHMDLWVERVPSLHNIADSPSRRRYCLLNSVGAQKRQAMFHKIYDSPDSWKALLV
jgi:hypothetical protein